MVGSAIVRNLINNGYENLIFQNRGELDLRNQEAVNNFFKTEKPDVVIDAAAIVGGILANSKHPYRFLMENLQIQNNLIDSSLRNNVQKFIFLGSSCIYPKMAPQPIKEETLLSSELEPTNEWYAIAKIAGLKACQAAKKEYGKDFISLMPTNLYGPNDNFDLQTSHVLPAIMRKFHEAKIAGQEPVIIWGDGTPLREFLHVDDLAKAVHFTLNNSLPDDWYNAGSGIEISIADLAKTIQNIVGHEGEIYWDTSKPNGTPRKLMDVSKLKELGWCATISLENGINDTYQWFLKNQHVIKEIQY